MEEHKASKELGLFFKRLLVLKEFVKEKASESNDETLNKIYETLNGIIKAGK